MADAPTTVNPVIVPTIAPAETTPLAQPVTSQPAPKTTGLGEQKPNLETTQAAETFDALNKLFDEPTAKAPVTTSTPPESTGVPAGAQTPAPSATPIGADDFQAKLDAFKAPTGAHPNVAAGMDQLKNLAKEAEARAQEYQAKVKTYEEQLKDYNELKTGSKLPEAVEKDYNELKAWRREMDYRMDPEFQKNYVKPVKESEAAIMSMLKEAGMKENVEKFILENGGIIALSQSGESSGNGEMSMAEWVDKQLLAPTPAVFRNRIVGKLTMAQDAIERGRAELQDFHANAKERWETRMKTMEADFNAGRDAAIAEAGEVAKPIVISPTSTPEERVSAEAHNEILRKAQAQYDEYLQANKDPKMAGRLLAKATQADVILRAYTQAQATIKTLQEKLSGIKSAGSHSLAGDHAPAPGQEKPSMTDLLKKSTESAMNDLFKTQPGF